MARLCHPLIQAPADGHSGCFQSGRQSCQTFSFLLGRRPAGSEEGTCLQEGPAVFPEAAPLPSARARTFLSPAPVQLFEMAAAFGVCRSTRFVQNLTIVSVSVSLVTSDVEHRLAFLFGCVLVIWCHVCSAHF